MNKIRKPLIKLFILLFASIIIFACAGAAKSVPDKDLIPIEPEETVMDGISDDSSGGSGTTAEVASDESSYTSTKDDSMVKKEVDTGPAVPPEESLKSADISSRDAGELDFYEEEASLSKIAPLPVRGRTAAAPPSESGLKAGYSDDNRQFNYFVNFLEEYNTVPHLNIDISERIIFNIQDTDGLGIPNAKVSIKSAGSTIITGTTLADGSFRFFPSLFVSDFRNFEVLVQDPSSGKKTGDQFTRDGRRQIDLILNTKRDLEDRTPLDRSRSSSGGTPRECTSGHT